MIESSQRAKAMFKNVFNRNARSADLLEIFFVAALSTVLLTRFYLELANYPSVGGDTLHIAHMLPGGLLMLIAMVISFSFIGYRALILASLLGGIGFGLFIDELGKFITRDNNYFFQPTVALLYLVFIGLFIGFRNLARNEKLTQREYLMNALQMSEEAVVEDLDRAEKERVLKYLHKANKKDPMVLSLIEAFEKLDAGEPPKPSWPRKLRRNIEKGYRQWVLTKSGIRIIDGLLIALAVWSLIVIFVGILQTKPEIFDGNGNAPTADLLQLFSTSVATVFILRGIPQMSKDRLQAYELFMKGVLINLFVTQFFYFYREQFSAMSTFIIYVGAYVLLRLAISEERRIKLRSSSGSNSPVPAA